MAACIPSFFRMSHPSRSRQISVRLLLSNSAKKPSYRLVDRLAPFGGGGISRSPGKSQDHDRAGDGAAGLGHAHAAGKPRTEPHRGFPLQPESPAVHGQYRLRSGPPLHEQIDSFLHITHRKISFQELNPSEYRTMASA